MGVGVGLEVAGDPRAGLAQGLEEESRGAWLRKLLEASSEALEAGVRKARSLGRPVLVSITGEPGWAPDPIVLFERAGRAGPQREGATRAGAKRAGAAQTGAQRTGETATTRWFWSVPARRQALVGFDTAWQVVGTGSDRFRQVGEAWKGLIDEAVIRPADAANHPPKGEEAGPNEAGVLSDRAERAAGGPVLLGGFAFDPKGQAEAQSAPLPAAAASARKPPAGLATTGLWDGFGDGWMALPRFLWSWHGDRVRLTLSDLLHPGEEPAAVVARWEEGLESVLSDPAGDGGGARAKPENGNGAATARLRVLEGPRSRWFSAVRGLVREIRLGQVEKVVLARSVRVRGTEPFSIGGALRRLQARYPECYLFAFDRGDEGCFLGATPEQLVRLRGGRAQTLCLAGSIARGKTEEEDRLLGQQLLNSAKDRMEHAFVVRALTEALSAACGPGLEVAPEPTLRKLANVQHLCTPVSARPLPGHTVVDLVESLHPTPAVGGFPRDRALERIRAREPFDRGWYAGPVGWLDARGEGEFAVGIRSALVRGREAELFAGCGIVAGSDPEKEFEESRLKLRPMLWALGVSEAAGGAAGSAQAARLRQRPSGFAKGAVSL